MRKYFLTNELGEVADLNPKKKIFGYLFFGLIWYPLAIFEFLSLSEWEVKGGRHTFNFITGILHEFAGRWGVLVGLIMIGNIFLYMAYNRYKLHKKYIRKSKHFYSEAADALLKIGMQHEHDYEIADAIKKYEFIIQEFSGSEAANQAKIYLKKIKKEMII